MTGPTLDPHFAADLREALAEQVSATTDLSMRRRWRRSALTAGAVVALAASGAGVAVAAGWAPRLLPGWIPGLDRDTTVSAGVASIQTGSADISTAEAPATANGAAITFVCIDAGVVTFPDGSSVTCDGDSTDGVGAPYVIDLPAGGAPLVFTAAPGVRWGLELAWVNRAATDWGVNARGESYGAVKDDGSEPDLLAAVSAGGVEGFIRVSELEAAWGPGPSDPDGARRWSQQPERVVQIPLYASDGTTVLADFDVTTRSAGGAEVP